ncbi:MAG: hypothetical protein DWP97_11950 [Calditrichaeota bacterium]|nr:MAG: hypothetical protein DWP97_11950 [Calditrichota bacterium]
MRKINNILGFGLIEVTIIIITIGILASIAMQSMTVLITDQRKVSTEREMEMLADAIRGNPEITNNGMRSDFGYIGDVGAFPPNLDALKSNPGGYATWNGPYIKNEITEDTDGFKTDEWGEPYTYTGGITITSTGGSSAITEKIADATSDYLLNQFNGEILDGASNPPGVTYIDSIEILITIPNGSGGTLTKSYQADASGSFTLDSLPVGSHPFQIIYTPNIDTLYTFLTILPRHKSDRIFRFTESYFDGSGSGGESGCTAEPLLTLGLILHWDFNDTTSQTVFDVSANGNDGVLGSSTSIESNDPTWTEDGRYCSGLYFDGSNDVVFDADAEDYLNDINTVTFAVWVKSEVTNVDRGIMFSKLPDGSDENFGIRYDGGGLYGGANSTIKASIRSSTGYNQVEGEANSQSTDWQHIALVWEHGNILKIYVDGVLQTLTYTDSAVNGVVKNVDRLLIGVGTKGFNWYGYIDDVRIYNRALSASEIQTLAN